MDTKARDIMSPEVLSANPDMTIEEVLKLLVNNRITGLPVVDAEGRALGVLSEFDIIQQIGDPASAAGEMLQSKVQFSKKVVAIDQDASWNDVLKMLIDTKVRRLPVLDQAQKVVGVITRRDIMKVLYYRAKFQ